jgi:hypothetical protein
MKIAQGQMFLGQLEPERGNILDGTAGSGDTIAAAREPRQCTSRCDALATARVSERRGCRASGRSRGSAPRQVTECRTPPAPTELN